MKIAGSAYHCHVICIHLGNEVTLASAVLANEDGDGNQGIMKDDV